MATSDPSRPGGPKLKLVTESRDESGRRAPLVDAPSHGDDRAWASIADASAEALTLPGLTAECVSELRRSVAAADRAAGRPPRACSTDTRTVARFRWAEDAIGGSIADAAEKAAWGSIADVAEQSLELPGLSPEGLRLLREAAAGCRQAAGGLSAPELPTTAPGPSVSSDEEESLVWEARAQLEVAMLIEAYLVHNPPPEGAKQQHLYREWASALRRAGELEVVRSLVEL